MAAPASPPAGAAAPLTFADLAPLRTLRPPRADWSALAAQLNQFNTTYAAATFNTSTIVNAWSNLNQSLYATTTAANVTTANFTTDYLGDWWRTGRSWRLQQWDPGVYRYRNTGRIDLGDSFIRQRTPEEIAADAVRATEYAERQRRLALLRPVAERRAEDLLLEHLDDEQRAQLLRSRFFDVNAPSGRRYRIHRGRTRNVQRLDAQGRVVAHYCIHPGPAVPDADTMLAQLVMLETDEDAFRRIANVS